MTHIDLLIVVALENEWSLLKRHNRFTKPFHDLNLFILEKNSKIAILQTGIGALACQKSLKDCFKHLSVSSVLHWGLSGSLSVDLPACALFWPSEICNLNHQIVHIKNNSLFNQTTEGRLLSVDSPLYPTAQKTSAAHASQAQAVDMESFYVATFCEKNNIPYTVCRGIIDTRYDDMSIFSDITLSDGSLNLKALFLKLIQNPKHIPLTFKMAWRHKTIQKKFGLILQGFNLN